MPAFIFRLQTLLDQKVDLEAKARAAVIEKQRVLEEQQRMLSHLGDSEKRIERSIVRASEELLIKDVTNAGTDIQRKNDHLLALRNDLNAARERTLVQKFAVEQAEMELKDAQTYAVDCFREAEKLARYRDKLQKRFIAETTQKEELETDDIGTAMYLSRRSGE